MCRTIIRYSDEKSTGDDDDDHAFRIFYVVGKSVLNISVRKEVQLLRFVLPICVTTVRVVRQFLIMFDEQMYRCCWLSLLTKNSYIKISSCEFAVMIEFYPRRFSFLVGL